MTHVSVDMRQRMQLIRVAGRLGVRLSATPPPLPRPNGGGQTLALCLCTGPYQASMLPRAATVGSQLFLTDCTRGTAEPAHRDIDHLINGLQLGNHNDLQNKLDHGKQLCVTTGMSTTLTCTITGMSITSPSAQLAL